MKTPFWALSAEQKKKVHEARLQAKYTYKKLRYSRDETFYYNKMEKV